VSSLPPLLLHLFLYLRPAAQVPSVDSTSGDLKRRRNACYPLGVSITMWSVALMDVWVRQDLPVGRGHGYGRYIVRH